MLGMTRPELKQCDIEKYPVRPTCVDFLGYFSCIPNTTSGVQMVYFYPYVLHLVSFPIPPFCPNPIFFFPLIQIGPYMVYIHYVHPNKQTPPLVLDGTHTTLWVTLGTT